MKILLITLGILFCTSVLAKEFKTTKIKLVLTEENFNGSRKLAVKKSKVLWTTDGSICELHIGKVVAKCFITYEYMYVINFDSSSHNAILSALSDKKITTDQEIHFDKFDTLYPWNSYKRGPKYQYNTGGRSVYNLYLKIGYIESQY